MSATRPIEYTPGAARDLKRLSSGTRDRILGAVQGLAAIPPQGDIKKLAGHDDHWRLRVGAWRVRFVYASDGGIVVLRILNRGVAYRD